EPTIVLFDEAENATPAEMKMVLTRLGEQAKLVVDGDPDQAMIRDRSGLVDAVGRLAHVRGVGIVRFDRSDIVRSGIVRAVLDAYDDEGEPALPAFITGV